MKNTRLNDADPAASPSSPSVRFTAFTIATKINVTNGMKNTLKFTVIFEIGRYRPI